jgi:spermidine/putrescine transport system ATP-binding protein
MNSSPAHGFVPGFSPVFAPGSAPVPVVELRDVSKNFAGGIRAVDRVSLDIFRGEFFSLLGPSGCGKTTLLRVLAGLEAPSAGVVRIGGRDVTGVPPYARPVNMVFQHYALFPHLNVRKNVAFGLRYQGTRGAEAAARVAEALQRVQLPGLEDRYPHQLSGGQRQRVALARALVLRPQVLLLDEPLAALDQKLRREMQVELKHLQRTLGITFVFVTHDQEEALTMSDRIAVMNAGRVEQSGPAEQVFETPRTEFVARFMGAENFFAATVTEGGTDSARVRAASGFEAPVFGCREFRGGERIRFLVRPEKLMLSASPKSIRDGFVGALVTIEARVYQGLSTTWTVADGAGGRFTVYEQNARPPSDDDDRRVGAAAYICWDPRHAVILDDGGGAP